MKATKEHAVLPNLFNRQFKQEIPKKVLLTDITYSNGKRAYLSTIKDSSTNEILAYNISSSLKVGIVLDTIDILIENTGGSLHLYTLIKEPITQAQSFKRKLNQ